ncbi:uncharacterized protein LOC114318370 [Camellia sinensis]|uniref:uncharacterized protein LOC114318370 n=1 Tax=Camellia sinensis TaxID=4442 RepID=UPI0010367433|nr:uncharacterized protein LOC114318370 [Camellia sinensis]
MEDEDNNSSETDIPLGDASTRCSKIDSELVMDYSNEFVTHEIFKSRDELIRWARHVGRRNGFVIFVLKSDEGDICGQLAVNKYIEWHRSCVDTETVTDLFSAHPTSLNLLRAFPKVLLMDCTYKTNRYRLPLLEIVGATSTDMTFSVAFAYLQYDKEDNYTWALGILRNVMDENALPSIIVIDRELALMNAICTVFPGTTNLLCRWHIELILEESKQASSIGIDITACGRVIQHTYGFSCAHEIANYIRETRPIPLTSVYLYWTNLDMLSTPHIVSEEWTYTSGLELFAKRFEDVDPDVKRFLLQKLRELAKLDCTLLIEPEVKSNPWGWPKLKIETSTRCEPSAFEIVALAQDSYSPEVIAKASVTTKKDVATDGNCGFRAIVGLMGFEEEGWLQVRKDLLKELHTHSDHYRKLFGSQERIDDLTNILAYFEPNPGLDRWTMMPDMDYLISSFYQVILVHLSMQQCLTFLPLRAILTFVASRKEILMNEEDLFG